MAYNRLNEEDVRFLEQVCGADSVFVGPEINEDYSHDELAFARAYPEVLVMPQTTEQVSQIMRYAHSRKLPVTPRGAGTGLCGGAVSLHGGIMLSTALMDKVIEIDEENLMARLQPGVILMNFQETVEKLGLFYPPDPGEKSASIGGNVMTNAGGMRALKYGVTRDYVLGMEVVLPDGQVLRLGGKVVKNSSGYNLCSLFVGSEGTLGIATEITVRLLPVPKRTLSLLVPFPSLETAIDTVPRIIKSKNIPQAIEFIQREILAAAEDYLGAAYPHNTAPAYLLLRFDGNTREEMQAVYEQVGLICLDSGAEDVFIADTTERQEVLWQARGAFLEALKALSEVDEIDVVVPPNKIADFVRYSEELRDRYGIRILSFGHAGDGNLHVYVLRDDLPQEEWNRKREQAMDDLYRKAREMGGLVSGEHGIGVAKQRYLHESIGEYQVNLLRQLKAVFDPEGILNPGKVV